MTPSRLVLGLAILATGCPTPGQALNSTTSTGTTGIDDTTSSTTSTGAPASTTSSSSFETTDSTSTTDDSVGVGFIIDVDNGPDPFECSVIQQDCSRGEKCSPWASDGNAFYDATRCVPVAPDPDGVDEPCTVEGSVFSGIDSCVLGSLCWLIDADTLQGVCTPHCVGPDSALGCDDPDRSCHVGASGVPALCLPQCDPLDPGACGTGQGCYPIEQRFECAPDASGEDGGPFETCAFLNACDPGSACIDGVCSPYCDVTAPDCPAGTQCIPFYAPGEGAPIHANLGVCGQEPA